jgi:hypothetical protein
MPVKSFKFVSPGVFINEIDNSFRPRRPDTIGPVIIGRSVRGLAMQPVKLESYSDFLTMYGDTVPGLAGGDIYRDGNYQSPMYGTYAAKAFLNASVAPVTYVRLLGSENSNKTSAGRAGWQTTKNANTAGGQAETGGAFGLFVFPSSSGGDGFLSYNSEADGVSNFGRGMLSAIWYSDQNCSIQLSGASARLEKIQANELEGVGMVIESDAAGNFTVGIKGARTLNAADEKFTFNFDDNSERFIRKVFNTNPQLKGTDQSFYDTAEERNYWLGETFEQELRDGGTNSLTGSDGTPSIVGTTMFGVILPIQNSSNEGPSQMRVATQEAETGWFVGQDLGNASDYVPERASKLFKLKGRGHGEWLSKNTKISIEKIRYSSTSTSDYGTFSIVIRSLTDSDSNPIILERFDGVTLDPRSTNYISRIIGDKYYEWNESERRLREYGEYPNQSKFVYVSQIEEGNIANAPSLIPFGYYGPPRFSAVTNITGNFTDVALNNSYLQVSNVFATGTVGNGAVLSGTIGGFSGSLSFPVARLRYSASDGGMSDQTDAYFGLQTTRDRTSTRGDMSMKDYHRLWLGNGGWNDTAAGAGVDGFSYVFTMDDVISNTTGAFYSSGSRAAGTSKSAVGTGGYKSLIDDGFDRFTAPIWGGFDGFDITKPDPVYNAGMSSATANDLNNYIYNTYKRAIDTVSDPEFVDMNLLTVPGLTKDGLTTHMIDVCSDRADALALVDLPGVYLPAHEEYYATLAERQTKTPTQAANDLRQRQIDSSYGATFYPWVQTTDENTGQALWIPPTVAMMGVLASSERSSQIWFAPAGFNRGGLSDGAAGIPVTSVSRRLTSKERDILYESRINPIASFPSTGIVVFGQKTLQERPSALDRINVRRLVIFLKKQISILSTQILFEQNVQATWNRFKGLIEPFLANVKTQFGITDYRLILDESTTTPDLVDQNVVYAKIMIKPARAIEYIAIDFIVASTGASFDD